MTCKKQNKLPFKTENNILIGEKEAIENDCTSVAELILNAFKAKPHFIGQVDALTGRQNTFQQMRERSVKCALWLKKQGVKPGDVIVTSTHNHLDTYIPFLASLYIGAFMTPWNVDPSIKNVERALELTRPKVIFINEQKCRVVYDTACLSGVPTKIVVFDEVKFLDESEDYAKNFVTLDSILDGKFDETEVTEFSCTTSKKMQDTALMLYSSGSTGAPKAVQIPQMLFVAPSSLQAFAILPGDVVLWTASLGWITSVTLTIRTILSCATAIKLAGFDSEKICQAIEKYKVTFMMIETGMCNQLVKSDALTKYNISSLRQVIFGGSMITPDAHKNIIKSLPGISMPIYGMTEVGMATCQTGTETIGSSGHVGKNVRIMIADLNTKKAVGPNIRGELYIKCPTMMNGYYKDPEKTKNAFDENGWLRTGDVGYYDEDGNIFVVDRIKGLIKYRGHHVSPIEIEALLKSHPSVHDSAVIPVPHCFDGQHPIAFVQKRSGTKVTQEELEELVAANMEDQNKLRGGIVLVEDMPRLENGKIDRMSLHELVKKK